MRERRDRARRLRGPSDFDLIGASPENTLLRVDHFRERYFRDDLDWQAGLDPART
jgi:hypothetical protein